MARALAGHGIKVGSSTPARWIDRDNIPGEYWLALDALKLSTLQELAEAADAKLRRLASV